MDSCPPTTSARNDGTPQNNVDDKSMLVRSDRLFFIFLTSFLFYFHSLSHSLSSGHAKGGAAPVTLASGAHRLLARRFSCLFWVAATMESMSSNCRGTPALFRMHPW